jgi:hypothetical protein
VPGQRCNASLQRDNLRAPGARKMSNNLDTQTSPLFIPSGSLNDRMPLLLALELPVQLDFSAATEIDDWHGACCNRDADRCHSPVKVETMQAGAMTYPVDGAGRVLFGPKGRFQANCHRRNSIGCREVSLPCN